MWLDVVEIWFGIANVQISSVLYRIICLPHDSGRVLFQVFIYFCRSVCYDNKIKFAEGLVIPVSTVEKMGWGFELVQSTVDFTARLKELNMDHAEFCIMSAIVLTYPGKPP